jgi:putative hydrolase of the HAD superfamily
MDMEIEEAIHIVKHEYRNVGEKKIEWYDIEYWFNHLGLNGDWRKLLRENLDKIKPYPDVETLLNISNDDCKIIVTSNTIRSFLEHQVDVLDIEFTKVFSAPSDFKSVKSPKVFKKICEILGIMPDQVIHVGDHVEFDYYAARKAGMKSILLDRESAYNMQNSIQSLHELTPRLLKI